jgi:hypothetical protein
VKVQALEIRHYDGNAGLDVLLEGRDRVSERRPRRAIRGREHEVDVLRERAAELVEEELTLSSDAIGAASSQELGEAGRVHLELGPGPLEPGVAVDGVPRIVVLPPSREVRLELQMIPQDLFYDRSPEEDLDRVHGIARAGGKNVRRTDSDLLIVVVVAPDPEKSVGGEGEDAHHPAVLQKRKRAFQRGEPFFRRQVDRGVGRKLLRRFHAPVALRLFDVRTRKLDLEREPCTGVGLEEEVPPHGIRRHALVERHGELRATRTQPLLESSVGDLDPLRLELVLERLRKSRSALGSNSRAESHAVLRRGTEGIVFLELAGQGRRVEPPPLAGERWLDRDGYLVGRPFHPADGHDLLIELDDDLLARGNLPNDGVAAVSVAARAPASGSLPWFFMA